MTRRPLAPDAQTEPAPPEGDAPAAPAPSPAPQPASLTLIAYRHRIEVAAPDSFSIVLRARERAFGVGVRSDRESPDPRLSYRPPGAAEPAPTHLVAQVGVIVSRCGRPGGRGPARSPVSGGRAAAVPPAGYR